MGWNGTGTFNLAYSWPNDAANGIAITDTRMQTQEQDMAGNGFGNCITRDGQGKASANQLPDTDNSYTFGSGSFRWSTGYFVSLKGTTTNDDAASGMIGEYISATVLAGSAVPITTNTATNVASISLTAGDWDVSGNVVIAPAGGSLVTVAAGWISTTSASAPTIPNSGAYFQLQSPGGSTLTANTFSFPVGNRRLSLSGTTTVYLSTLDIFTVGTLGAYGFIGARRAR